MAANQVIQTRIDGDIKTEAAAVLAAIGLTVSDAVRLMPPRVAFNQPQRAAIASHIRQAVDPRWRSDRPLSTECRCVSTSR
ncbi:MAG: type II toxin-antitoxin system RelB/DinJ family antitoxin [Azonexus sp.]|nr:type II toxin-antitoxin system RelB/DinJ family antitoxin [Azonexus sp.]